MTARKSWLNGFAAFGMAVAFVVLLAPDAGAQTETPKSRKERAAAAATAEAEAPKADYSKEFRKLAAPVQTAVNEKKWADVLAALPALEAIPSPTHDDLKAIATWRLQATQGVGDQDAFAAAIEKFLADGYAEPQNVGAMHRQLAAYYSGKKDSAKTLEHFQAFVEATPDVQGDELETLGRLHLQAGHNAEGCQYLGKAIDQAKGKNEKPKEMWYQLRDQCFLKMKDDASRLANLEALSPSIRTRVLQPHRRALSDAVKDDRTVMLVHAWRLPTRGGLGNVGAYLNYADGARRRQPGRGRRPRSGRGMKEGIVPSWRNQQFVAQAKAAVASDKKSLPGELAAAAKNPKGEVDVKIGLGFYSTGDYAQAAEAVKRGIGKGGVARLDDANLLLGASLLEAGKADEARAAFQAAKAAAPAGSPLGQIADLWLARAARGSSAPPAG
jgi:hypothetical protein